MFERGFEKFRGGYHRILQLCIEHAAIFLIVFLRLLAVSSVAALSVSGARLLSVGGQRAVQVAFARADRARALRIRRAVRPVDDAIRETIPKKELVTIIDNIGLPYSGINTAY